MRRIGLHPGHTLLDYYTDCGTPEPRAIQRSYRLAVEYGGESEPERFHADLRKMLVEGRVRKEKEMVEIPLYQVLDTIYQRFGCEVTDEMLIEGMDIFYGVLVEDRKLVPGTIDMLEMVKAKGYAIGLVSDVAWGLPSDYPRRDMDHFHLTDYFDDLVFSTDVGLRKPHPKMFKIALSNLGAEADRSVFVGNSLQCDVKGALGVGMTAVLKRSGYYQPDDSIVPDASVDLWSDLVPILEENDAL